MANDPCSSRFCRNKCKSNEYPRYWRVFSKRIRLTGLKGLREVGSLNLSSLWTKSKNRNSQYSKMGALEHMTSQSHDTTLDVQAVFVEMMQTVTWPIPCSQRRASRRLLLEWRRPQSAAEPPFQQTPHNLEVWPWWLQGHIGLLCAQSIDSRLILDSTNVRAIGWESYILSNPICVVACGSGEWNQ